MKDIDIRKEILDGTYCEDCGSNSDTFMSSALEDKADTWTMCVKALVFLGWNEGECPMLFAKRIAKAKAKKGGK